MAARLIGLAGPAGVGKSTAATLIALQGEWRVMSFASPLRAVALDLHPEWTVLDFQPGIKETKRAPTRLGWGRVEDILSVWASDLTGTDVTETHPFILMQAMSGLREVLSPRETLRLLGDFARAVDAEVFTRYAARQATQALHQGVSVVIDDVRFESEAQMIRDTAGLVLHMTRQGVTFRRDHNSEIGLLRREGDADLINPGDINGLRQALLHALLPRARTDAAAIQ